MRILVGVGSDLSENREMSQEQGFLGNNNQPRVSQGLSRTLTEYDDGQQFNITAPYKFVRVHDMPRDKNNSERKFVLIVSWIVMIRSEIIGAMKISDSGGQ